MKHLINRDDYIYEYFRINDINNNELYESLLSTLFGGLKMLFKKDWANIKCKNTTVLKYLQEIDKSLTGYMMVKMEFSNECSIIRQNIADYFNDILDYKLKQVEKEEDPNKLLNTENKEAKGVAKKLNITDKTLLDTIDKYKSNINIACKNSPKLREYADIILNSVQVFINGVVIDELEKKGVDKAKLEEEKEKLKEEEKKLKAIRKKMDDLAKNASDEELKKISKERDNAMKKLGIKTIPSMNGDKSIESITNQFNDILSDFNDVKINESALPLGYKNILKNDTYIGILQSLEEIEWKYTEGEDDSPEWYYNKFILKVILNKINTVFGVVAENKKMFEGVPSASVQAMLISLANVVIYGFIGSEFNIERNDARISLLSKCAIDSDATIGFNLPLIDPKKPNDGNFFVSIMNQFKNAEISSKEIDDVVEQMSVEDIKMIYKAWGEDKEDDSGENDESKYKSEFNKKVSSKLMKQFKRNIDKLFNIILDKVNKIKDDTEKKRKSEAAKAQRESEVKDDE